MNESYAGKARPLTPAQRKAAQKARMVAEGLVRYPVWIPNTAEAREKVRAEAEKLRNTDER